MTGLREPDLGTPAAGAGWAAGTSGGQLAEGQEQVEVTIDRHRVSVPSGTSILRAAALAGIPVPKLCATDSLAPLGSCRLCLVEVEGRPGTPASCTTPVTPGASVRTQTPVLEKLRRGVMELYISDHPLDCLTCAANGDCELQDMAGVVGLREVRYGYDGHNHLDAATDASNPYFSFDPAKCIVCARCVRACSEVQGTFALTIAGRGFDSVVSAGAGESFLGSECVSCGACVQACPTSTLQEKSVIDLGLPTRVVETTCAYCGVGCSFRAELRGDEVVRMVPSKAGGANQGHSCVKGRFAWGYASHRDRVTTPMMRDSINDSWREASWDEAIGFVAQRLLQIQADHGRGAIGAITSSRCTNEEVYVMQRMVRAAFGNNNVDTCARVCHSPTGYGLATTFGTSAGTQDFASVEQADVILLIGANPTDAHPVFASRLKRRLREGAQLIVVDPRRIDLVRSAHVQAAHHLQLAPGTNVAIVNALAHVIVTRGLADLDFMEQRCEGVAEWVAFISGAEHSPEALEEATGVPAAEVIAAAELFARADNGAIYYGLGVTEHSQGSTMVMGLANLAMATGNIGREGVGVNPLRGQNNVQGSCDMGSFPHELPGYRHVSGEQVRQIFEAAWGRKIDPEPGLRIPNMFDAALGGSFWALFVHGEDIAQSDPNTAHVGAALQALDLLVVQDLFLNETAKFAHVFLPGTSFLEKDGTFTNAERRINRVRPAMAPVTGKAEWQIACDLATAMGYPMSYPDAAAIMDEIAATTPTFSGVSFELLDTLGSLQWPCNEDNPAGTPTMHVDSFVRGRGRLMPTPYVATQERSTRKFPLILTTGRILSQYNVGAQTRRTGNVAWHPEDVLELHPHDAADRGISSGDLVALASRTGQTQLRAEVTERVPAGVVYTTFHHPVTGANVVTTENSDWATNCPEYKVTAVQVRPVQAQSGARAAGPVGVTEGAAEPSAGAHPALEPAVRLAQDLALQFARLPLPEAVQAVSDHVHRFWDPRLRARLAQADLAEATARLTTESEAIIRGVQRILRSGIPVSRG